MIMSGNEAWNRNFFKRRWKVDRDGADITLSGRLFQMVGPSTGKARPPTVDRFKTSAVVFVSDIKHLLLEGKYSLESTDPRESEIHTHLRP